MHVELNQRLFSDDGESVNLAGLDHENVACTGLELLAVHDITPAPGLNELNLVVRMPVRPRSASGLAVEQEDRHADVALVRADEMMRAAPEGQVLLTHFVHAAASW